MQDANGQALVHVYARETLQDAQSAKVLTSDEARRIAVNVAKLAKLLGVVSKAEEASPLPIIFPYLSGKLVTTPASRPCFNSQLVLRTEGVSNAYLREASLPAVSDYASQKEWTDR